MITDEILTTATEKLINNHKKGDEIRFFLAYAYIDQQTKTKQKLDFVDILVMRQIAKKKFDVTFDVDVNKNVLIYK